MTEEKSDAIKIGINGFGRIGRMVLRATLENPKFFGKVSVVAVNDPFLEAKYMAYQFKYDSTQGTYGGAVTSEEGADGAPSVLIIETANGPQQVTCFACRNPGEIDWPSLGVQVVIESTGIFLTADPPKPDFPGARAHLRDSVKLVVMSAPSKDTTPMFVMGVNNNEYAGQEIISNASCTTNCLAPIVKVLNDAFGIESGLMTTVHAVTATQKTVDAPNSKKWRAGRGAFQNIIPSSTGAAKALGKVYPAVNGLLDGMAFRVPVPDGSVVDLTCTLKVEVDKAEIDARMMAAAEGDMNGVLQCTGENDFLVSSDIIHNPHSSIYDSGASMVLQGRSKTVKVISWYDNEWGYSNRLVDLIIHADSVKSVKA